MTLQQLENIAVKFFGKNQKIDPEVWDDVLETCLYNIGEESSAIAFHTIVNWAFFDANDSRVIEIIKEHLVSSDLVRANIPQLCHKLALLDKEKWAEYYSIVRKLISDESQTVNSNAKIFFSKMQENDMGKMVSGCKNLTVEADLQPGSA